MRPAFQPHPQVVHVLPVQHTPALHVIEAIGAEGGLVAPSLQVRQRVHGVFSTAYSGVQKAEPRRRQREGGDREGGERGEGRGDRGDRPRRDRDEGPEPEFAPAFLTRDDD